MTLKGLRTLRSLMILTIFSFSLVMHKDIIEIITTVKSMMFHPFLMYELLPLNKNPYAMIFSTASKIKKLVNTMSAILKNATKPLLGSFKGLSRASKTLETAIKKRVIISKV
jgi:hypothetical protein